MFVIAVLSLELVEVDLVTKLWQYRWINLSCPIYMSISH